MPPPARFKPIYNYIDDLPALEDAVDAVSAGNSVRKTIGNVTTFGRRARLSVPMLVLPPSSTCKGASRAGAAPNDVEHILRKILPPVSTDFFITETISPATRTREPTLRPHHSSCANKTAWMCAS